MSASAPTLADLRPGDLMFGPIGGLVPGVLPVGVGQLALATRRARLSWRHWWRIRHVGVVVQAERALPAPELAWTPPRLVQAMPHGAEEIAMTVAKHWTERHVYIRPLYPYRGNLGTAYWVANAARGYVGTPYNFLTYGALAARALHLPVSKRLLRKWISTRADMMCSQLADQALADTGFHVFDDGRLPQDVVPAELFRELLLMPGTKYLIPSATSGSSLSASGWRNADDGIHQAMRG